jgi:hypothetical protein
MTTRYPTPRGDKRALASGLFVANRQVDALTATREDAGRAPAIGLDRLYAYAVEPGLEDAELERALAERPDIAAAFQRILDRTARHRLPRVAAASPGTISSRDGTGCHIRFQDSRAEPDQTYVIIEVEGGNGDGDATAPRQMFIVDAAGTCRKYPLPEARNGVIQFLVERGSPLLEGLLDIKTEVFLK